MVLANASAPNSSVTFVIPASDVTHSLYSCLGSGTFGHKDPGEPRPAPPGGSRTFQNLREPFAGETRVLAKWGQVGP